MMSSWICDSSELSEGGVSIVKVRFQDWKERNLLTVEKERRTFLLKRQEPLSFLPSLERCVSVLFVEEFCRFFYRIAGLLPLFR